MNDTHPSLEQLTEYVHGELSAAQDAAIHLHLQTCADCSQAHDAELRLVDVLRAHARAEEREMPPGLATAIHARAAGEGRRAGWWSSFPAIFRPAAALPFVAAAALGLYFFMAGHPAPKGRLVDASAYLENHAALTGSTPFGSGDAPPIVLTSDDSTQ